MKNFCLLLVFSCSWMTLALSGCDSQSNLQQPIRQIATLDPDPALLAKLGESQDVDFATLRVPADFKLANKATKGQSTIYQFSSPRRDDGTAASLQITTVQLGANDKPRTLGVTLDKFLGAVKQRRTQWTQSQMARGLISDLEFAHQSWEGVEPKTGAPMKGMMYVTYADKLMISVSIQDVLPMADETLPLAEAAIRTLDMK